MGCGPARRPDRDHRRRTVLATAYVARCNEHHPIRSSRPGDCRESPSSRPVTLLHGVRAISIRRSLDNSLNPLVLNLDAVRCRGANSPKRARLRIPARRHKLAEPLTAVTVVARERLSRARTGPVYLVLGKLGK